MIIALEKFEIRNKSMELINYIAKIIFHVKK